MSLIFLHQILTFSPFISKIFFSSAHKQPLRMAFFRCREIYINEIYQVYEILESTNIGNGFELFIS